MIFKFVLALSLLFATVFGDVSISKPTKGATYKVSGSTATVPVSWIESNADPELSEIETYSFTICTGSNSDINGIKTLKKVSASDITDDSYDLEIPASIGEDGNYFIQIYAAVKSGGYTINYSQRFTLSGMTGSTEASGSGDPPDGQTSLDSGSTATSTGDISKSFSIFYTSQTGKTRYAPMQMQPGTTVTQSTWSRKYQTSSVSYFTTIKNTASQLSTITPGWSYTMSSAVNYATPAEDPSVVGWYNPSSRVSSATLSSLSKTTSK